MTGLPGGSRVYVGCALGLLFLAWAVECLGAPPQCGGDTQTDFSVGMVVTPAQAVLASSPTSTNALPQKGRRLTRGDVVFVRPGVDRGGDAPFAEWPALVCAVYRDAKGLKSYGWLRKDELLRVLVDVRDDESTFDSVNASLGELVAQLPSVRAWPLGGRTAQPIYYEGFTGSYCCVKRMEVSTKKLCVTTTSRWFGDDECGDLTSNNRAAQFENEGRFAAFLLNNAIVVVSECCGMWGNHSQSDPEGIYFLSQSAGRYCEAEAEGPVLAPGYLVIVPGKSLGKLSLRTFGSDSSNVKKILGEPTRQDVEGRILVYHSPRSGNDLLIDRSAPAIEFTSPYFVTSRGVAINNVEYAPEQFEQVRDEANGGTRYNFRRGGLSFLIFDKPMETKGGVISRLGMIGPGAATRSPALLAIGGR